MCLNAGHRGVGAAYLDHAVDLMKALRALLVFLFGQVPPAVLVHKGIVVLIACSDADHLLMAGLLHPSLQPCLDLPAVVPVVSAMVCKPGVIQRHAAGQFNSHVKRYLTTCQTCVH